jgi:hypothetical protein
VKILGQGVKDITERFFHGMYVSAQGNPFYTGIPVDGTYPESGLLQLGSPAVNIFLIIVVFAMLSVIAMYYIQQYRMIEVKSSTTLK